MAVSEGFACNVVLMLCLIIPYREVNGLRRQHVVQRIGAWFELTEYVFSVLCDDNVECLFFKWTQNECF